MKITKSQLKQIIKKELRGVLSEAEKPPPEASGRSVNRIERDMSRRNMYSDDLVGRRKLAQAIDAAAIALGGYFEQSEESFLDWVELERAARGDSAAAVAEELYKYIEQHRGYQK